MAKLGKRLKAIKEAVDSSQVHSLKDAVRLLKSHANCKFDETVDCCMVLNVDMRKTDQQIRGVFNPPSGLGKKVRVMVFATGEHADAAKSAGADIVGDEALVDQILQDKKVDVDMCIATPNLMASVGKLGRLLGSRGLLPNPKLGTVTTDVKRVVEEAKKGRVEFRPDRAGVLRVGLGKASFSEQNIFANLESFLKTVAQARPETVKGVFLQKMYVGSTMGPSFRVDLQALKSEGVYVDKS